MSSDDKGKDRSESHVRPGGQMRRSPRAAAPSAQPAPAVEKASYQDWEQAARRELAVRYERGTPTVEEDEESFVEAPFAFVESSDPLLIDTGEGLLYKTLYTGEDSDSLPGTGSFPGFAPFTRGATPEQNAANGQWSVLQPLDQATPSRANAAAVQAVDNMCSGVRLIFDRAARAGVDPDVMAAEIGAGGMSGAMLRDFQVALDGVPLDEMQVHVACGTSGVASAAILSALAEERGTEIELLHGAIEFDPIGELVTSGKLRASVESFEREMAHLIRWSLNSAPNMGVIGVDGTVWREAGATVVQELAFVLSTAVEYLRSMDGMGFRVDDVARRIHFMLGVGRDISSEVAKLRAARLLWAEIINTLRGDGESQRFRATAAPLRFDQVANPSFTGNHTRHAVALLSASLGGAECLQLPSIQDGDGGEGARRWLAERIPAALRDEFSLPETIDPLGGSFAVESQTQAMAEVVWDLFKRVEARGGMLSALRGGFPQSEVAEAARDRLAGVVRRSSTLAGINRYRLRAESLGNDGFDQTGQRMSDAQRSARIRETRLARTSPNRRASAEVLSGLADILTQPDAAVIDRATHALREGATLGEIEAAVHGRDSETVSINRVTTFRLAEPFEALRRSVRRHVLGDGQRKGKRPGAFIACLGDRSRYYQKANLARDFFLAAEFRVNEPMSFDLGGSAARAAVASGAHCVVLCADEMVFPETVPDFVDHLSRNAPFTLFLLAAEPSKVAGSFELQGVDYYLHEETNIVETASEILERLGVSVERFALGGL